MTRLPFLVLPGVLTVALGTPQAFAQDPAPPAHVAFVEGRAVLEHETTSEDVEANLPLDTGDRLRTERGRVEVLLGDGSILQLDEETTIDVLSDSLVRQLGGRLAIVAASGRAGRLQVDTPAGSMRITSAGEFRVSVFAENGVPEIEVAVIRGSADLFNDSGTVAIRAGGRALARQGEAPSQPMSFNSARWDAFDRWSQDRLSLRRGAASHRYVPPPLRPYGAVLDTYGSWNYEPTYGYVWFPHVVGGWRPYYQGRWRFYGRFGWTWVGGDAWSWPTHHYGRWGTTAAGAWFWVPGRRWGPAWVHWAVAPGYVSWCPLGFDGRPVVPFGYAHGSRASYRRDPWTAWTVVRSDHFGGYGSVGRLAVDGRRFTPDGVRPFVLQTTAPGRPYAVPRSAGGGPAPRGGASLSASGPTTGVAVPRGSNQRPGRTAAARGSGRDLPSSSQPANRPGVRRGSPDPAAASETAGPVLSRRSSDARAWREGAQGGHYGSAVRRRPPSDSPSVQGTAAPRGARPAWSPDSVPVYRGGSLTSPSDDRGAPRGYEGSAGPARGSGVAGRGLAEFEASDSPRAVPRDARPSYPPAAYEPPGGDPRSAGQRRPSSTQPPVYAPPGAAGGEREHGTAGPRYREAPGRASAPPPTAAPREAPDGGGSRAAVPRGGAQPRAGAAPPPPRAVGAGAPPSRHR
jgi:hypothetical protein